MHVEGVDEVTGRPSSRATTASPDSSTVGAGRATAVLAGLTLLALVLRFYRLGAWSLESDEVFMLRDSVALKLTNPRPLMYLLNHYVVAPVLALDEFGLRLLPAVFGVLSVPVFYLLARRLVGPRAGLIGAFFIATSPLFVYYSQFARYWTLVFMLCAVFPFALYLGIRDANRRMLALGAVTGGLALVAHPVSVLLLAGIAAWVILTYGRREVLAQLWQRRLVRFGLLATVVVVLLVVIRLVPVLQGWIAAHDVVPESEKGGEFLLRTPSGPGVKQISLLLAYVQNLTPPLVLAAVLGIYMLWETRTRSLALFLVCLWTIPTALILLIQLRTAVSPFYLIPPIPVVFLGAGVFLDRLIDPGSGLRPRWLLSAAVGVMIFLSGAPTLASQYRDGKRWDFRGASRWLDERLSAGDVVIADQPQVVSFYLPRTDVRRLIAEPERLAQAAGEARARNAVLWLVSPAPSHAFRTNPRIGSLNQWIYTHCQLRNTIGVGRLDFRQNFLQIYRCPPVAAADQN
jgi:mannosyltransferase